MTTQERRWRKAKHAEWQRDLIASAQHRDDCLCRAMREPTGPACFQQLHNAENEQ